MTLRLGLLLVLACAWLSPALANQHGVERVRFIHYGVDDGLSQATVRAMTQDESGFMWLGTQDGLNRFDGHNFRVYRHDSAGPTVGDNHIICLARGRDGETWMGTQAGGLSRYDPLTGTFSSFQHDKLRPDSLAGSPVTALLLDSRKRLWVASGGGNLQWLDLDSGKFRNVPGTDPARVGSIRMLRERHDGRVLVASRNGLWLFDAGGTLAGEWRNADEEKIDAYDVVEAADGSVWVGTGTVGLLHFSAEGALQATIRMTQGLADDAIRALALDRQGRLWIGTYNGLSRMDVSGAVQRWYIDPNQPDGLSSNRIQSLYEDRDGLIWIGTWLNGVSLFNPRTEAFVEIRPMSRDPLGLSGSGVASVMADSDGTLWLGVLEGGGLEHFDLERGLLGRYTHDPKDQHSLAHNQVNYMIRDATGTLWAATMGGVERMRPDAKGFDHFIHDANRPGSLASDSVLHLLFDRQGTLWVGTQDAGVDALCAGCTEFKHYRDDPADATSLGGDNINVLFLSSRDEFWVGMRPGGLARLDRKTGRFEHFRPDPSVPGSISHDSVTVIYEDRKGTLWIGTQGGGLNQMLRDDNTGAIRFRAYTRKDGLGADAVGGILEDEQGRVWASTIAGMSRLDPKNGAIVNFNQRDGVQNLGYFVGAYAELPDRRMVFGGLRGATVFDPTAVNAGTQAHSVAITALRTFIEASGAKGNGPLLTWRRASDGKPEVSLAYVANDFSIEYSALSFTDPKGVDYSYHLQGLDDRWIVADADHRFATYTNVKPANYVFQVKARHRGGAWGPTSELHVNLAAPPWLSKWAYSAYLLLGAAFILTIGWQIRERLRERRRSERKLRQSEERLKLALWGTGDELWDMNLVTGELRRTNPLTHLEGSSNEVIPDVAAIRPLRHPDDAPGFDHAFREHVMGKTEFFESTFRARGLDGNWRWLRSRGRVVQRAPNGHAQRLVGTTEDVTEIKEHEHALERINQDLERRVRDRTSDLSLANENLRQTIEQLRMAQRQLVDSEKMAALGGLVAGIAHEINTPLGISVTAASHLELESRRVQLLIDKGDLKKSDLETFQRVAMDSTQMILRNLQRADKLVKSFKQVAVDQSSEQRRMINLRHYLDEVLTSLHPALKKTKHRVVVESPENLVLDTYPGAIYQIVVNLVMNTLLHGFDGVEAGTIRIVASIDGKDWLFDYSDDGRGMSEEVRRRIFEPFFTTRRGQGGSGLGMHIVFNLAHQVLHGNISCESAPGQGVRFSMRCPVSENEGLRAVSG